MKGMARGWDSKSVESQIESAASDNHSKKRSDRSPAEIDKLREREGLVLSRTRVLHQMEACQNTRYRVILEKALADLDSKLAAFELRRAAHSG
jgi:hypothetical protein